MSLPEISWSLWVDQMSSSIWAAAPECPAEHDLWACFYEMRDLVAQFDDRIECRAYSSADTRHFFGGLHVLANELSEVFRTLTDDAEIKLIKRLHYLMKQVRNFVDEILPNLNQRRRRACSE